MRGGRGARERILVAARKLFYRRGINATGIAALTAESHVSTRTFYQHFESKEALVEEYIRGSFEAYLGVMWDAPTLQGEEMLERVELDPVERILAIFSPMTTGQSDLAPRGCPFHNAMVENAGASQGISDAVVEHKVAFREILIEAVRECGITEAEAIGRQIAVIFEGSAAYATSCNDRSVVADARDAARTILMTALAKEQ